MLNKLVGDGKWNFDLDDCDRILRIATEGVRPNEAIDLVANGKLMAKGELVDVDGRLGIRIIKIF